jgi:hypothetical protein
MTEPFETRLQTLAQGFVYPPAPQIAEKVMAKLSAHPMPRRFTARRLAWVIAIVIALIAGLMAVPPVRAAVLEFIQIGIVRIFLRPPGTEIPRAPTALPQSVIPLTATPGPTAASSLIPFLEQIAGETTLEKAREVVGFPIPLPTYPPDLGQPNRVFTQDLDGWMVVLVWLDPQKPEQVRMSLHIIEAGSWAIKKFEPKIVQETTVNGHRAVWAVGPYPLALRNKDIQVTRLIEGHVLIWAEGDLTYRLETDLPLEEAIQIAESLQVPPINTPTP